MIKSTKIEQQKVGTASTCDALLFKTNPGKQLYFSKVLINNMLT